MAAKARCDACGKEVGVASIHRRIGFVPGSRVNQVCGACFSGKLTREEKLRFAKGPAAKRKERKGGEGAGEPDGGPPSALDELRGLG